MTTLILKYFLKNIFKDIAYGIKCFLAFMIPYILFIIVCFGGAYLYCYSENVFILFILNFIWYSIILMLILVFIAFMIMIIDKSINEIKTAWKKAKIEAEK